MSYLPEAPPPILPIVSQSSLLARSGPSLFSADSQPYRLEIVAPALDWNLATGGDVNSAAARLLRSEKAPIVICERESVAGNWKDMLASVGSISAPPLPDCDFAPPTSISRAGR